MPEALNYDVNAVLRTHGSFTKDAKVAGRAADRLGTSWSRMGDKLVVAGERVRGSLGGVARALVLAAGMAGAVGLVGGIGLAAKAGIEFRANMEQGALGLATMFQTFGVGARSAAVISGETGEWAKNIELAKSMQAELFDIAKASPASFEDIASAYQSMAPGLTGVTKDLMRQRDLMEKIAVLAFTTDGDFAQLGADVGRVVQGLAGADVRVFKTLEPVIREAFEAYTGEDAAQEFATQFNKMDPTARLEIFEKALSNIPPEVNQAFAESFGGVAATMKSELQVLAGAFGGPLMESMRKAMVSVTGEDSPFEGLETVARFAGGLLAGAADRLFARLIAGADYVQKNWMMIATRIQQAGVLAGAALKAAAVVATTRMVAGTAMIWAGKGMQMAQRARGGAQAIGAGMRKRTVGAHAAASRGLRGEKGGGMFGRIGRTLRKANAAFGSFDRGANKMILKVAVTGVAMSAAAAGALALTLAFGAVVVVVAGMAAFVISNWEKIKTSLVDGMRDGAITLIPLITALYTFWERLKLVGEILLGGADTATIFMGGVDLMTGAVNFAGTAIGIIVKTIGVMIGAWAALKLGMGVVFQLIATVLRAFAKIPKVGEGLDATIGGLEKASRNMNQSAQDTMATSEKFMRSGDDLVGMTLDNMKLNEAKAKAQDLQKSLTDMLTGKGKKGGRRRGSGVKIGKVEVIINTNDPDPDRLFAAFIPKLEAMSDKRVSPYDALPQGT